MQLYFIRHGQSQNNAHWGQPDYKESPDPALTEIGVEQAGITAEYLAHNQPITHPGSWNPQNRYGFGLTHIYASLMERAVHTAAPTIRKLDLPFSAWDIHESGGIFGRQGDQRLLGLPGKPRSFFEEQFPELNLPAALDESGWWNRPFETEEECQARAERVWADLLAHHGDKEGQPEHCVAFFSHGGFFIHLVCAMLNLPWRQAADGFKSWFLLNNCAISRIDIIRDEVVICYMNRTDHLPAPLIT